MSAVSPAAPDKLRAVPVETESDDEIIMGFADRHLYFRLSFTSRCRRATLAIWVRLHNFAGRMYLMTIMPFHVALAGDAVGGLAPTAFERKAAS
ncbi:MAG: DUF2867 domain-containing protein [Pseudomonadota bacterium]